MKVYLDTSALNWLVDHPNIQIEKLKNISHFVLTANNLWEFQLNSDRERADRVLYWCQMNCEKYLLKSNSEILVSYIELGCPISSRRKFWSNPYTELALGKLWSKIHGKIDRNLNLDYNKLVERTKTTRKLSSKFRRIVEDTIIKESSQDYFVDKSMDLMRKLDIKDTQRYIKTFLIAIIVVQFVFCIGLELDNSMLRSFWKKIDIDDPLLRLEYLIAEHPLFFNRGPIAEITKMVETQITMKNNKSRGLLHDCFHLQYAYYCNLFLSNDKHFTELRDNIDGEAYQSIKSISELRKSD